MNKSKFNADKDKSVPSMGLYFILS